MRSERAVSNIQNKSAHKSKISMWQYEVVGTELEHKQWHDLTQNISSKCLQAPSIALLTSCAVAQIPTFWDFLQKIHKRAFSTVPSLRSVTPNVSPSIVYVRRKSFATFLQVPTPLILGLLESKPRMTSHYRVGDTDEFEFGFKWKTRCQRWSKRHLRTLFLAMPPLLGSFLGILPDICLPDGEHHQISC